MVMQWCDGPCWLREDADDDETAASRARIMHAVHRASVLLQSSVVYVSVCVCLLVTTVSPTNTPELIEVPFRVWTHIDSTPKELHCVPKKPIFIFFNKWLRLTGEVDKCVRCPCQILSGFNSLVVLKTAVLVSRPLKTEILRSWFWSWHLRSWSWSWSIGLGCFWGQSIINIY